MLMPWHRRAGADHLGIEIGWGHLLTALGATASHRVAALSIRRLRAALVCLVCTNWTEARRRVGGKAARTYIRVARFSAVADRMI
jgi:hypothetical protein